MSIRQPTSAPRRCSALSQLRFNELYDRLSRFWRIHNLRKAPTYQCAGVPTYLFKQAKCAREGMKARWRETDSILGS